MAQQSTNFLFKQGKRARKGKSTIGGPLKYLEEMDVLVKRVCSGSSANYFLDIDAIDEALRVNAAYTVRNLLIKQDNSTAPKKNFMNVINGIDVVHVSQTHINYVTFWMFKDAISGDKIKCPKNKRNMQNMLKIFGLT